MLHIIFLGACYAVLRSTGACVLYIVPTVVAVQAFKQQLLQPTPLFASVIFV